MSKKVNLKELSIPVSDPIRPEPFTFMSRAEFSNLKLLEIEKILLSGSEIILLGSSRPMKITLARLS